MAGHRPFKQLRDKMSPERRARLARRVAETLAEMRAEEAMRDRELEGIEEAGVRESRDNIRADLEVSNPEEK